MAPEQIRLGLSGGAELSACRRYRYRLWRTWDPGGKRVAFVGLNPSTADENKDDPTIRKCIGFAKRWGFGAMEMLNLFAWRSTSPRGLLSAEDPVGPDNNVMVMEVLNRVDRAIWAWGSHPPVRLLVAKRNEVRWLSVPGHVEVFVFGRCADGSPKHPLMLAYDTTLVSA